MLTWAITDDLYVHKDSLEISRYAVSQEELDQARIKLWEMEDALELEE